MAVRRYGPWWDPDEAEQWDEMWAERGRQQLEAERRHHGSDAGAHHRPAGDDGLAALDSLDGTEAMRQLFVEFRPL